MHGLWLNPRSLSSMVLIHLEGQFVVSILGAPSDPLEYLLRKNMEIHEGNRAFPKMRGDSLSKSSTIFFIGFLLPRLRR